MIFLPVKRNEKKKKQKERKEKGGTGEKRLPTLFLAPSAEGTIYTLTEREKSYLYFVTNIKHKKTKKKKRKTKIP